MRRAFWIAVALAQAVLCGGWIERGEVSVFSAMCALVTALMLGRAWGRRSA